MTPTQIAHRKARLSQMRRELRSTIAASRSKMNWRVTFYGFSSRNAELMNEVERVLLSQEIARGRARIHAEMTAIIDAYRMAQARDRQALFGAAA